MRDHSWLRRNLLAALLAVSVLAVMGGWSAARAQAPEYQAPGLRAGSILLFPVVEVQESYNDNIFLEESNEKSSLISKVKPSVIAVTDWEGGEILMRSGSDLGFYASSPDDNYTDYFVSNDTTYEASPTTTIYAKDIGFWHLHEGRGADDVPLNAAEPTTFNTWGGEIGTLYKPSFLGLDVSGKYRNYIYDDTPTVGGGAPIDGGPRDFQTYGGSLKIGYDVQPGYEAFVRGVYSVQNYDEAVNSGGFNRDSDQYSLLAGFAYEPSRLITAKFDAGYFRRVYDNPALASIDGPAVNADVEWSVTPLTTIGLQAYTKVDETISATAAGKLVYGSQLAVKHELLPNVVLDANLGYDNIGFDGSSSNRVDNVIIAGLGATYWMAQLFYIGVRYDLRYRDSNQSGFDYTQNSYMFRIGAQW